jgi:lipopolysaccharide transport system ATP-binding protein
VSSDTVISVSNLSKAYRLGTISSRTLREDLSRAWARLLRKPDPLSPLSPLPSSPRTASPRSEDGRSKIEAGSAQSPNSQLRSPNSHLPSSTPPRSAAALFWALRDISFEVKQGEVLGIIGANGAGKSTLLKILSRITAPTKGEVRVKGRIGSLLEVGTGFHPDLTGRENIFLNGAILGMSRNDITRKFDEIVAFSGLEQFIDTPVKRYSSGMYVRLAFAVAAHLDPEILILDEVLAVGDAAFQKKCLGKMRDVAANQGRTVLFVSHNLQAVASLCSRAILLNEGKIESQGEVEPVVSAYVSSSAEAISVLREQVWTDRQNAPGNDKIRIRRMAVLPEGERPGGEVDMSTPFRLEVEFWNLVPNTSIIVNICFYALDGSPVFESLSTKETQWHGRPFPAGLFRSVCFIPGNLLNEGTYRIRVLFVSEQSVKLYDHAEAGMVAISDLRPRNISFYGRFIGHVHPLLSWRTEFLERETSDSAEVCYAPDPNEEGR